MRTVAPLGSVTVIRLLAEEDAMTAASLEAELREHCGLGPVVVDLVDSVFIDGAVAGVLAAVALEFPDSVAVVIPDEPHHPARRLLVDLFFETARAVVFATSLEQGARHLLRRRADRDIEAVRARAAAAIRTGWGVRSRLNTLMDEHSRLLLENRSRRGVRPTTP